MKGTLMHLLITLVLAIASPWPDTPAGSIAQQWVNAYPSEAAMRAFYARNLDPEDIKKRSIDERIVTWRQAQKEFGNLKFVSVVSSKPEELKVMLARADGEKREYTFTVKPSPPHKLVSITLMEYVKHGHSLFPWH